MYRSIKGDEQKSSSNEDLEDKVFCINCKFAKRGSESQYWLCRSPTFATRTFVTGQITFENKYCNRINNDGNCHLYAEKTPPPPRLTFWQRFLIFLRIRKKPESKLKSLPEAK